MVAESGVQRTSQTWIGRRITQTRMSSTSKRAANSFLGVYWDAYCGGLDNGSLRQLSIQRLAQYVPVSRSFSVLQISIRYWVIRAPEACEFERLYMKNMYVSKPSHPNVNDQFHSFNISSQSFRCPESSFGRQTSLRTF
jgi:hypothetical protein